MVQKCAQAGEEEQLDSVEQFMSLFDRHKEGSVGFEEFCLALRDLDPSEDALSDMSWPDGQPDLKEEANSNSAPSVPPHRSME